MEKTPRREYYRKLEQGPIKIEQIHKRKDGSTFPIQSSSCLVTLGGQERVLAIDRDITEDKRAEEMLRASEVRYHRLFEAARDGILILDAETGMVVNVIRSWSRCWVIRANNFLEKEFGSLGSSKILPLINRISRNCSRKNLSSTKICRWRPPKDG